MSTTPTIRRGPVEHWNLNDGAVYWRNPNDTRSLAQFGIFESHERLSLADVQQRTMKDRPSAYIEPQTSTKIDVEVKPLQFPSKAISDGALRSWPVVAFAKQLDRGSDYLTGPQALDPYESYAQSLWVGSPELRNSRGWASAKETATPPVAQIHLSHALDAALLNNDANPLAAPQYQTPDTLKGDQDETPLVIIGVIDDGLPFAHQNFATADGTGSRLDYLWLQASRGAGYANNGRAAVPFGLEVEREHIEGLMKKYEKSEDNIYRDEAIGAIDDYDDVGFNLMRNYTHGAHVMGLAAGFTTDDIGADKRDKVRIIGVQLPRSSLKETSGFSKESYLLAGVHYILARAEAMVSVINEARKKTHKPPLKNVKVLINISLGTTGGPKDGNHILEQAIDEVAQVYDTAEGALLSPEIVFPTGNTFASQIYGESPYPEKGGLLTIPWRLQPNDRTSNYMEIWFEGTQSASFQDISNTIDLSLALPSSGPKFEIGPDFTQIAPTLFVKAIMIDNVTIGQISLDKKSNSDWRLMLCIAPSEHEEAYDRAPGPTAPSGTWLVYLTHQKSSSFFPEANSRIRCSILRDEDPAGTGNGGRQSYFEFNGPTSLGGLYLNNGESDSRFIENDFHGKASPRTNKNGRFLADEDHSFIAPFGTINGWATNTAGNAYRTSVAGYTKSSVSNGQWEPTYQIKEPTPFSAAGRMIGGNGQNKSAVKTSAVANNSISQKGVRGVGTRSGSHTTLVGTSAAAPAYVRSTVIHLLTGMAPCIVRPPSVNKVRLG